MSVSSVLCIEKKYFHYYINSWFKGVFRFQYLVWLWIYFLCIQFSNSEIKQPFRYFGNDFRKLIFGCLTFDFRRNFSASLFSLKQIFASKIRIHFPESEISMMLNWWLVKFVFKVETREGSQNFRFRSITQSLFHFQLIIDQPRKSRTENMIFRLFWLVENSDFCIRKRSTIKRILESGTLLNRY